MYGADVMEPLSATSFRAAARAEDVKIEFIVDEDGAVNTLLMHRKGDPCQADHKQCRRQTALLPFANLDDAHCRREKAH